MWIQFGVDTIVESINNICVATVEVDSEMYIVERDILHTSVFLTAIKKTQPVNRWHEIPLVRHRRQNIFDRIFVSRPMCSSVPVVTSFMHSDHKAALAYAKKPPICPKRRPLKYTVQRHPRSMPSFYMCSTCQLFSLQKNAKNVLHMPIHRKTVMRSATMLSGFLTVSTHNVQL